MTVMAMVRVSRPGWRFWMPWRLLIAVCAALVESCGKSRESKESGVTYEGMRRAETDEAARKDEVNGSRSINVKHEAR